MFNVLKTRNKAELITGVVVAFAINFLFFIYAPLETFFLNKKDLFFDTWQIVGILLPLFAIGTALGILLIGLLWLINEKLCFFGVTVYFIAYVLGVLLKKLFPTLRS